MIAQSAAYREAIDHLPCGGTLVLRDVSWEEYEQLLSELEDGYAVRVSYDWGRLEIVSPSGKHEKYKEFISHLARVIADETGCDLECFGSTTFKHQQFAKGAEPDSCFYVQRASQVVGNDVIDLNTDAPPDIVVEVDLAHDSRDKFALYASLGVPETWRYDGHRAEIYRLTERDYLEAPSSRAFPVLSADELPRFVTRSEAEGRSAVLRSVRAWLGGLDETSLRD